MVSTKSCSLAQLCQAGHIDIPKALKTVYAKPFPTESSHCAVTTRPNAEMKKKLAIKALAVVTPLHSIKLRESVVSVVPNAPRASADCTTVR